MKLIKLGGETMATRGKKPLNLNEPKPAKKAPRIPIEQC